MERVLVFGVDLESLLVMLDGIVQFLVAEALTACSKYSSFVMPPDFI
jgi:hypothetical protein